MKFCLFSNSYVYLFIFDIIALGLRQVLGRCKFMQILIITALSIELSNFYLYSIALI
jgi:hypothetical protein